jgi:hypothetical protein
MFRTQYSQVQFSYQCVIVEVRVQSQSSSCESFVGQVNIGTGSSQSTSVLPSHYHSTLAPPKLLWYVKHRCLRQSPISRNDAGLIPVGLIGVFH